MRMPVFHAAPSHLWLKRPVLSCISNGSQLLNQPLQSPQSLHLLCNGNTLEVYLTWAIKPDPGTNCILHATPEEYLMLMGVWLNVKPRQSSGGTCTAINCLQVLSNNYLQKDERNNHWPLFLHMHDNGRPSAVEMFSHPCLWESSVVLYILCMFSSECQTHSVQKNNTEYTQK